ncbi:MAG TPA: HAMP domain-containing protein [Treponemataceae bacterium]|nr:HAMP domain-containing protein [Treponemataceae bacterium]
MRHIRRRAGSALYSPPFVLFALALVTAASYALARAGLDGVFSARIFASSQGILLLAIGPFVAVLFLSLFLFGMLSEHLSRRRNGRFPIRLFARFALVVAAATVPQALVVSSVARAAATAWLDPEASEALEASSELADLYLSERVRDVERVGSRFLSALAISNYRARAGDLMADIRLVDAYAVALQVYLVSGGGGGAAYEPVAELGDSDRFLSREGLDAVPDGIFGADEGSDLIRWGQTVRAGPVRYRCVYTSFLPEGLDGKLASIRAASGRAAAIARVRESLPSLVAWLCAVFGLPPLIMALILALSLSARASEPVLALEEAASRVAAGDYSFRAVPRGRDEIAETAAFVNSIADALEPSRGRDKRAVLRL